MGELSRRDKKMIAGGGVFLVLFSLVQFIWLPAVEKKEALAHRSTVLDGSIQEMESLRNRYREHAGSFDRDRSFLSRRGSNSPCFPLWMPRRQKAASRKMWPISNPFPRIWKTAPILCPG